MPPAAANRRVTARVKAKPAPRPMSSTARQGAAFGTRAPKALPQPPRRSTPKFHPVPTPDQSMGRPTEPTSVTVRARHKGGRIVRTQHVVPDVAHAQAHLDRVAQAAEWRKNLRDEQRTQHDRILDPKDVPRSQKAFDDRKARGDRVIRATVRAGVKKMRVQDEKELRLAGATEGVNSKGQSRYNRALDREAQRLTPAVHAAAAKLPEDDKRELHEAAVTAARSRNRDPKNFTQRLRDEPAQNTNAIGAVLGEAQKRELQRSTRHKLEHGDAGDVLGNISRGTVGVAKNLPAAGVELFKTGMEQQAIHDGMKHPHRDALIKGSLASPVGELGQGVVSVARGHGTDKHFRKSWRGARLDPVGSVLTFVPAVGAAAKGAEFASVASKVARAGKAAREGQTIRATVKQTVGARRIRQNVVVDHARTPARNVSVAGTRKERAGLRTGTGKHRTGTVATQSRVYAKNPIYRAVQRGREDLKAHRGVDPHQAGRRGGPLSHATRVLIRDKGLRYAVTKKAGEVREAHAQAGVTDGMAAGGGPSRRKVRVTERKAVKGSRRVPSPARKAEREARSALFAHVEAGPVKDAKTLDRVINTYKQTIATGRDGKHVLTPDELAATKTNLGHLEHARTLGLIDDANIHVAAGHRKDVMTGAGRRREPRVPGGAAAMRGREEKVIREMRTPEFVGGGDPADINAPRPRQADVTLSTRESFPVHPDDEVHPLDPTTPTAAQTPPLGSKPTFREGGKADDPGFQFGRGPATQKLQAQHDVLAAKAARLKKAGERLPFAENQQLKHLAAVLEHRGMTTPQLHALRAHVEQQIADISDKLFPRGRPVDPATRVSVGDKRGAGILKDNKRMANRLSDLRDELARLDQELPARQAYLDAHPEAVERASAQMPRPRDQNSVKRINAAKQALDAVVTRVRSRDRYRRSAQLASSAEKEAARNVRADYRHRSVVLGDEPHMDDTVWDPTDWHKAGGTNYEFHALADARRSFTDTFGVEAPRSDLEARTLAEYADRLHRGRKFVDPRERPQVLDGGMAELVDSAKSVARAKDHLVRVRKVLAENAAELKRIRERRTIHAEHSGRDLAADPSMPRADDAEKFDPWTEDYADFHGRDPAGWGEDEQRLRAERDDLENEEAGLLRAIGEEPDYRGVTDAQLARVRDAARHMTQMDKPFSLFEAESAKRLGRARHAKRRQESHEHIRDSTTPDDSPTLDAEHAGARAAYEAAIAADKPTQMHVDAARQAAARGAVRDELGSSSMEGGDRAYAPAPWDPQYPMQPDDPGYENLPVAEPDFTGGPPSQNQIQIDTRSPNVIGSDAFVGDTGQGASVPVGGLEARVAGLRPGERTAADYLEPARSPAAPAQEQGFERPKAEKKAPVELPPAGGPTEGLGAGRAAAEAQRAAAPVSNATLKPDVRGAKRPPRPLRTLPREKPTAFGQSILDEAPAEPTKTKGPLTPYRRSILMLRQQDLRDQAIAAARAAEPPAEWETALGAPEAPRGPQVSQAPVARQAPQRARTAPPRAPEPARVEAMQAGRQPTVEPTVETPRERKTRLQRDRRAKARAQRNAPPLKVRVKQMTEARKANPPQGKPTPTRANPVLADVMPRSAREGSVGDVQAAAPKPPPEPHPGTRASDAKVPDRGSFVPTEQELKKSDGRLGVSDIHGHWTKTKLMSNPWGKYDPAEAHSRLERGISADAVRRELLQSAEGHITNLTETQAADRVNVLNGKKTGVRWAAVQTKDGDASFAVMPKPLVQRWHASQKEPGLFNRGLRYANTRFVRSVLPLSATWHMGNATDMMTRLALSGAQPGDAALARELRRNLADVNPDLATHILDSIRGAHFTGQDAERQKIVAHIPVIGKAADRLLSAGGLLDKAFAAGKAVERKGAQSAQGTAFRQQAKALGMEHADVQTMVKHWQDRPELVEDFQRRTLEIVGDYINSPMLFGKDLRVAAPFIQWIKASLKFTFHTLPAKHPLKVALMMNLSQATQEQRRLIGADSMLSAKDAKAMGLPAPASGFLAGGIKTPGDAMIPTGNLTSFSSAAEAVSDPAQYFGNILFPWAAGPAGRALGSRDSAPEYALRTAWRVVAHEKNPVAPGKGRDTGDPGSGRALLEGLSAAGDAFTPGYQLTAKVRRGGRRPGLHTTSLASIRFGDQKRPNVLSADKKHVLKEGSFRDSSTGKTYEGAQGAVRVLGGPMFSPQKDFPKDRPRPASGPGGTIVQVKALDGSYYQFDTRTGTVVSVGKPKRPVRKPVATG